VIEHAHMLSNRSERVARRVAAKVDSMAAADHVYYTGRTEIQKTGEGSDATAGASANSALGPDFQSAGASLPLAQ